MPVLGVKKKRPLSNLDNLKTVGKAEQGKPKANRRKKIMKTGVETTE